MRPSDDQIEATVRRAAAATKAANAARSAPKRKPTLDDLATPGFYARQDSYRKATGSRAEADLRLERIIKGNELSDLNYLSRGLHAARSVARIVVRCEDRAIGYGTGFLVAPGVLITNEHVLRDPATIGTCTAELQYELDARGTELPAVEFALLETPAPLIDVGHDLAVVAVAPTGSDGTLLERFGWLNLDPTPGKSPPGEWLTIVQHPGGERKQLCVRENKLLEYDRDDVHVTYSTDTVAGSSGSPVFNNSWDVVALHHSGVPETRTTKRGTMWVRVDGTLVKPGKDGSVDDDVELRWNCNEGIRISAIHHLLEGRTSDELARRVVRAPTPPGPPAGPWPGSAGAGSPDERVLLPGGTAAIVSGSGTGQVVVPLELVIGLRAGSVTGAAVSDQAPVIYRSGTEPATAELARPSDFNDRKGYDPGFLGAGFEVPLPTVTGRRKQDVLPLLDGRTELRYGTYSVVMHRERRLAFFSAANRGGTADGAEREDSWRLDPRLSEDRDENKALQLGDWFYVKNPFDQGHLTRFADTNWGSNKVRNGKDSFHFPNCAPQHEDFNRGTPGLWYRLEFWVVETFDVDRLCIFNGPIFDAPRSREENGEMVLRTRDPASPDPTFGTERIRIPKQYFKVAAYVQDGKLAAQSFIVTQEDLLQDVEGLEERLTPRELRLYRVPLSTIKRLTGLDFGPLGKRGTRVNRDELAADDEEVEGAIERVVSLEALKP